MATGEASIVIHAPLEKVFAFLSTPTNLPEVWPSMQEVKDVESLPSGGHRFHFVYRMAGMRFEGESEDAEFVPNQHWVTKTSGGITSTFYWTFAPEAGGTRVTVRAEYTVPIPLLGKLAEAVVARQNQHEAELVLANTKARLEG